MAKQACGCVDTSKDLSCSGGGPVTGTSQPRVMTRQIFRDEVGGISSTTVRVWISGVGDQACAGL